MTIEERMQNRFHMNGEPHVEHRYYETYKECITVANEQREIDIERACKWIEDHFGESYLEYFRKAMEG